MISQEEKSRKVLLAEEKLAQAKAQLNKAKREQRAEIERAKSHHKYMIGGVVAKYFPECYEFDELEMNRIIACAFKNTDIQNIIAVVKRERPLQKQNAEESGGIADEKGEDKNG
jgi:pseudouridine-5'-phosphate glycosidase